MIEHQKVINYVYTYRFIPKHINYDQKEYVHLSGLINDIIYHILTYTIVSNNNLWIDLSHQVNTIATVNVWLHV